MKFTVLTTALLLSIGAIAEPEGLGLDSIAKAAENAASQGKQLGSDVSAEAASIANAVQTGGPEAVASLTGDAASMASAAETAASSIDALPSEVATKASSLAAEVTSFTTTNSQGETITGMSTMASMTNSASMSASSAAATGTNAGARPEAVGAAVAGLGMLGVMAAL